jgi:hypothetical protein
MFRRSPAKSPPPAKPPPPAPVGVAAAAPAEPAAPAPTPSGRLAPPGAATVALAEKPQPAAVAPAEKPAAPDRLPAAAPRDVGPPWAAEDPTKQTVALMSLLSRLLAGDDVSAAVSSMCKVRCHRSSGGSGRCVPALHVAIAVETSRGCRYTPNVGAAILGRAACRGRSPASTPMSS